MRVSLYDYCGERGREALLSQWSVERNAPLTPGAVSYGSKRKVWWQCEKGHQWQAMVYTRTGSGAGCPYCTRRRAAPGENDLASQRPDLAAQWHPVRNGSLTPEQVVSGAHKRVWWLCEKGHEWQAMVKSRSNGCGCPVCSNRKLRPGENDLATTHPELVRQWHPEKNGQLTPRDLVAGTRRKVWWRCGKGHEWRAAVASRANGAAGCPVCAGKVVIPGENDLAGSAPGIAAQWHPTKNGALTPDAVAPCSNRKVWWLCGRGHEYQAAVGARTVNGSGCPYCAGKRVLAGFNDLATLEPAVAAQWHPTLNGTLTPEQVTVGSHRKAWWLCPEGHAWKAMIYSRSGIKKSGCPVCMGRVRPGRHEYVAASAEQKANHGESRI